MKASPFASTAPASAQRAPSRPANFYRDASVAVVAAKTDTEIFLLTPVVRSNLRRSSFRPSLAAPNADGGPDVVPKRIRLRQKSSIPDSWEANAVGIAESPLVQAAVASVVQTMSFEAEVSEDL